MFGDIRQLPPVGSRPLYSTRGQSDLELSGAYTFLQFRKVIVLGVSMRQKDSVFREVLDEISKGKCSTKSFDILSSRFRQSVPVEVLVDEKYFPHLYTERKVAQDYNMQQLLSLHRPIARIPALNNNDASRQATVDEAGGLPSVIYLSVGSRVMLKANLGVKVGLVNGTIETIQNIFYGPGSQSPENLPAAVMVRFDQYTGPCWESDVVSITPITRTWTTGTIICSRSQVPLVLSWGITVHQSQGQTFDKVYVDIGKQEFQAGLSYVALSRCRTLEGLVLCPPFLRDRLDKLQHMTTLKTELQAGERLGRLYRGLPCNNTPLPPPPPRHRPRPATRPIPRPPSLTLTREVVTTSEGERVEVATMPKDGHCLFWSLLHQLGQVEQGYPEQVDRVILLRSRVVDHIRQRGVADENFLYHLLDAINVEPVLWEQGEPDVVMDIHHRLTNFLESLLVNEWGSTETIAAVSELEDVVIWTYFEAAGDNYRRQDTVPGDGRRRPGREISTVYRNSQDGDRRVHYDSFVRIIRPQAQNS